MQPLEQTAEEYAINNNWCKGHVNECVMYQNKIELSFKAGAKWQKEQYTMLIELTKYALAIVDFDANPQLKHKLETELKQL
jgi:hypothetical protein